MIFNPVIGGKALQPVEFTRVLHVPMLQNNLFACLHLTKHKHFEIHINSMQRKWTFNVKVACFSVPLFAWTTVLISRVQLNRFLSLLSLPTGSLLFLSLLRSGIVAVVTTTLQTSPRLGNGRGWGNPCGLRSRVTMGWGTGLKSATRQL